MIVDASALAWLDAGPPHRSRHSRHHSASGEAARLLGTTVERVQADRPRALRDISHPVREFLGRVERPSNPGWPQLRVNFVNSSGNPHLAQGGSGDVLAGFIAGLLVQPQLQADVGKTLRSAVWQHGAAADALQAVRAKLGGGRFGGRNGTSWLENIPSYRGRMQVRPRRIIVYATMVTI